MPHPVADAHLLARAEAWPFVSDAALASSMICLGRTEQGPLDDSTRALADDLEQDLRRHAAGRSLDILGSLRDHAWFDGVARGGVSLAKHLCRLANRVVEPHGDRAVLALDGHFSERLEHQRWLSLFLPSDLLIAARYASLSGFAPPVDHLSLCTPALGAMLHEAPVAETHLHLGAALPFELLWTGLLGSLRGTGLDVNKIPREKAIPFGSGERFLLRCTAAATGRLLMAAFLRANERRSETSFATFGKKAFGSIAAALDWPFGDLAAEHALQGALQLLLTGRLPVSLPAARLAALYRRLAGAPPSKPIERLAEIAERDPLSTWLVPGPGRALPETRFMTLSIAHLLGDGRNDCEFSRLFWQYVRVRCKVFRYLVVEPGTAGLDWFKRYYDRIAPLRAPFKRALFESGLMLGARDVRLGAFEGRTAPDARWFDVRDEVQRAATRARSYEPRPGMPRPEVGLVLHFLKEESEMRGTSRCLHADPRQIIHGARFGSWSYKKLREALAITRALEIKPELLLVLRGLDVASAELAVPTWPLVPLFQRVRAASCAAADRLARQAPWLGARPLQVTCHAGEDYRRLSEGLRRVHELLETHILCAGDRIGHGLSLGHDPDVWARGAEVVFQPREERLDDLLWEIDRYSHGEIDADASRLAFVRSDALRLGREIYATCMSCTVDDLVEARRLRHDPHELSALGFPFVREPRKSKYEPRRLLHAYLTEAGTFWRGRVPVEVRTTRSELTFLHRAQKWIQHEVIAREITIESNPSSNFLVGNFLSVEDHPSFRLHPLPGMSPASSSPLLLSVNSDDPVSFATSLADEYAHLYGAMLRNGVGSAEALAWLAARRQDGYRSRFTLPASQKASILETLLPGATAFVGSSLPRGRVLPR